MALEEDPSGAICFPVGTMPRLLHVLVLTSFASLSVACAERSKSEDTSTPSASTVSVESAGTTASTAAPIGLKGRRMLEMRHPGALKVPTSIVGQPGTSAAAATSDAAPAN